MSKKRLTRRQATKGLGIAGLTALAGCGGGSGGGGGEEFGVGMVYTEAGLGDEGFNDAAQDGLMRAKEQLGITVNEAEPASQDQYSTYLRQYAKKENIDLVCGLSFEMQNAMTQVSQDFPDQPFTIVDTSVDQPNVASYLFKEHEGCYLVGKAAGLLTQREFQAGAGKTNTTTSVGFIGGKRNPVIEKFHAGFEAGINSFETSIDLQVAYAGTWSSPSKGKSIAESMYNEGADIVFPAAGGTGLGVFQAAQDRGKFAFGVDKPQSEATPKYADVILGSMVKRVGNAFYNSIQKTMNENHGGGQSYVLGLEKEGVNLVWGNQLGSKIPQDVKNAVSSARQGIINGAISVPSTTYSD
ncbi:MAG: BMP family protein [Halobacteriaceae archaeon]